VNSDDQARSGSARAIVPGSHLNRGIRTGNVEATVYAFISLGMLRIREDPILALVPAERRATLISSQTLRVPERGTLSGRARDRF
jgi:hypothetical protein